MTEHTDDRLAHFLFAFDQMRRFQKDYFHSRSQKALVESKKWEAEADNLRAELDRERMF